MNLDARTHIIEHPLSRVTATNSIVVTVLDPDNHLNMPLYCGDPTRVHEVLGFGRYKCIIKDWARDVSSYVTVWVFDNSTILGHYTFDD